MEPDDGAEMPGMMNGGVTPTPMSNGPTGGTASMGMMNGGIAAASMGMTPNVGNKLGR